MRCSKGSRNSPWLQLFHKFSDGKHSSNLNDVDRFEQKSAFDTKSYWPTEDSYSSAGEFDCGGVGWALFNMERFLIENVMIRLSSFLGFCS